MKIFTPLCPKTKAYLLIPSFLLACYTGDAQTFVYTFTGGALKSGTANTNGAVYLFTSVKTGTDAIVKITNITSGVTLASTDSYSASTGGYDQAFQPTINVSAGATINSYVEFTFTFIVSGTYNTSTKTGTLQAQNILIPATALDIDGNGAGLFEFDELNLGGGSMVDYSSTTSQLSVTTNSNNVTGQDITGTNYSGINVSNTDVMFTVLNNTNTLTSFVYRTGAISSAAVTGRVASLAFFKPTYPFSVLASSPLENFNGWTNDHSVNLQWQLAAYNDLSAMSLERSTGIAFQTIKDYPLTPGITPSAVTSFQFEDTAPDEDVYYRLKMTTAANEIQYSNTLHFPPGNKQQSSFRIYPAVTNNVATLSMTAATSGPAVLKLTDYSGHEFYRLSVLLNKGVNYLPLNLPGHLNRGNCIATLQAGNKTYTQKMILIH